MRLHPRLSLISPLAIGIASLFTGCAQTPPAHVVDASPAKRISATETAMSHRTRARMALTEGKPAEAAKHWALADEVEPNNPTTLNGLGLSLALIGETDKAVATLQKGVAIAPTDARLINNLGRTYELQGKPMEARLAFERVLRIEPHHAKAAENLARLNAKRRAEAPVVAAVVLPAAPAAAATPVPPALTAVPVAAAPRMTPSPVEPMESPRARVVGIEVATNRAPVVLVATPSLPQVARTITAPAPAQAGTLVKVELINGNGVAGSAARLKPKLSQDRIQVVRLGNQRPYDVAITRVVYRPGMLAEALAVARQLPAGRELVESQAHEVMQADVRVVLGRDLHAVTGKANG